MYFSQWGSQAWVFWLLLYTASSLQSWSFLYLQQHLSFTLNYQETKMDGSFHFAHTKIRGLKTALTAVMNSLFGEAAQDRSSGSLNSLDRKWADEELKGRKDDGMEEKNDNGFVANITKTIRAKWRWHCRNRDRCQWRCGIFDGHWTLKAFSKKHRRQSSWLHGWWVTGHYLLVGWTLISPAGSPGKGVLKIPLWQNLVVINNTHSWWIIYNVRPKLMVYIQSRYATSPAQLLIHLVSCKRGDCIGNNSCLPSLGLYLKALMLVYLLTTASLRSRQRLPPSEKANVDNITSQHHSFYCLW